MSDEIELTNDMLYQMASMLPKHPPLSVGGGDSSVKEMYPELSRVDLDKLYEIYKCNGGTMRKE